MATHAATTKTAKGFQVLGPQFFASVKALFRPAILEHCATSLVIVNSRSWAWLRDRSPFPANELRQEEDAQGHGSSCYLAIAGVRGFELH
jgi:hypothetical protein